VSRPLGWVILATFFHFASLYGLLATLPLYVLALGGSATQVALIVGVFSATSLLTRPLFGGWIDRFGRRRFMVIGAAIYVVAALGYPAIRSVAGLLAWRAFHALGLATFGTAAAALAGDLAPGRRRGRTMGLYGLAQAGALTVGPGAGRAVQVVLGYRGLFAATAASALAALCCVLAIGGAASPQPARERPERPGRAPPRGLAGPAVAQLAASVPYGTIVSFAAVVAQHRGIDAIGAFFGLFALSSFGIRLAAGPLYDARGVVAVLLPACGAVAGGMALLAMATGSGSFLLAAALAGVGIGATHTALVARVVDQADPPSRARSMAAFTASWELGVGLGSVLAGRVAEATGFATVFFGVAALALLALATLPSLRHRSPRRA
jgi:MFS family permease